MRRLLAWTAATFAFVALAWSLIVLAPYLTFGDPAFLRAALARWPVLAAISVGFWTVPLALWWLDEATAAPLLRVLALVALGLAAMTAVLVCLLYVTMWTLGADGLTLLVDEHGEQRAETAMAVWLLWSLPYLGYELDVLVRRAHA